MKSLGRILAWIGASGMMAGVFGILAIAMIFNHYSHDLPSFEKLAKYDPPVMTRLYAADGRLLAEYAKEKRIFVPLKAIPRPVIQAFVAAEDRNFFAHNGIDIFGILRAVRDNFSSLGTGQSMVGGSTITQQVVKNFLLTNEKSFGRKIREAILAYRITKVYTKEKILELYPNQIYLGKGSYGVAAAALNYFNKPLDELRSEEIALLAAMPKAPANYDPNRNYDAAKTRRDYVLRRMVEDGYISASEASRAMATPILLERRSPDEIVRADFFAEEVRRTLAAMYGANVLYEGGLTVKTTVDGKLQKIADNALRSALMDYDRRHGYRGALKRLPSTEDWEVNYPLASEAIDVPLYDNQRLALVLAADKNHAIIGLADGSTQKIPLSELLWARKQLSYGRLGAAVTAASDVLRAGDIIIAEPTGKNASHFRLLQIPEVSGGLVALDPHTGRVLAMSGGYAYGKTEFNRATQAKRQPGSAFKPFVYLTAFENGFTPATVVMDGPVEISQGPGLPLWRPQNYEGEYIGAATLRTGLEKSRNAMTVRLAQMVGLGRIINVAKRFGIYQGDVPRNYSMVLGAKEATLLNLTNAYAMIANGGRKVASSLIERIDDRHGKVLYRRDNRKCKGCLVDSEQMQVSHTPPDIEDTREVVLDPRVAYQMTSLMEGVVQRGTAASARVVGKPLAGKTGTTNDSNDAWFIGYSPDLVAGVYIGFDKPRSLGAKETGGRVALPAFIQFMTEALKDTPAKPFRTPSGIQMVQVDRQTGLPPYVGIPHGALISEAFITGGNIYKPPLPEGAAEEEVMQAEMQDDILEEGYDPNAEWQDRYYMTPEQIRAQGQSQDPYRTRIYPAEQDGYNINATPKNDPYQPQRRNYPLQNYEQNQPATSGVGRLY